MTAFNVYDGDGTQTQFPITFDYFNVSEIEVLLWDPAVSKWQQKTNTTDYNIATSNINFVSAPVAPPSGITGNVLILRKTEVGTTTLTSAQAAYTPGTAINAADLNKNQIQALRAVLDLRDSKMPIHGKTWADSSQETRLYSDLNMTGRDIKNVGKIKFETFSFTEGGVEVETDTKDIPTQTELALKDDITSVNTKLALNVTNEDAKLATKADLVAGKVPASQLPNIDPDTVIDANYVATDENFSTADHTKLDGIQAGAEVNTVTSVNGSTGAVTVQGFSGNYSDLSNKPNLALKADLVGSVLDTSQVPELAITKFCGVVANENDMLALAIPSLPGGGGGELGPPPGPGFIPEYGDWCSRSDNDKVYIVTGPDATLASDWTALTYPGAPITSVAGRTGVVTLSTSDIAGLATVATTGDYSDLINTPATLTGSSTTLTTASISSGQTGTGTVTLPKTSILISVEVSGTAYGWFRLYNRADSASTDSARNRSDDPVAGSGVLLETINTGSQTINLSPQTIIANAENTPSTTFNYRFTNDGSTGTATFIFKYLPLEV